MCLLFGQLRKYACGLQKSQGRRKKTKPLNNFQKRVMEDKEVSLGSWNKYSLTSEIIEDEEFKTQILPFERSFPFLKRKKIESKRSGSRR